MEKVHIIFDVEKCVGCFNCMLACQDEHCGNDWYPYTAAQEQHGEKWLKTTRCERGSVPFTEVAFVTEMCRHCQNAACEKAFPDAVVRRDDGIVLLKPDKAKGNRALVDACPYGMIKWNEEQNAAQKCTMCAHLLDNGWEEPRCVQACPLRALRLVRCSDEAFDAMTSKQGLRPLEPGANQPRLMYKNLYKVQSVFICGAVSSKDGNIEHAIENAEVTASLNGVEIESVKTNFFGEYKLDHLPKNAGEFDLTIQKDGFAPYKTKVSVGAECVDVGVVFLG